MTIAFQIQQIKQEIEVTLITFRYLVNQADATPLNLPYNSLCNLDTIALNSHPILAIYKEEVNLANAQTALEKEKLKPDFNVGVNNNSFRGIGPDNMNYSGSDRFTSVQFGVAVPLFVKNQKSKINALKVKEKVAENNVTISQEKLKIAFEKWLSIYKSNLELLNSYKASNLKNASIIKITANNQFINGEINYLDYVMLLHQAITIENNYIDLRKDLNNSIIQLNFFTLQN